jgi:hypothetical protein
MKPLSIALLLALPAIAQAESSRCEAQDVLSSLHRKFYNSYYTPGSNAEVSFKGSFRPLEGRTVQVSVEDFRLRNIFEADMDLFVIVGRSLASDATTWIAWVDSRTCNLKTAQELLHTGGGGL